MPTNASINTALNASASASSWLRAEPGRITQALTAIRLACESHKDALLALVSSETGLTIPELTPEFARMTGTLALFADLAARPSPLWTRPAIDRRADSTIGPNHDIRRILIPVGPVVAVLGASNFPFAYGVLGGDTASALAAGSAVAVKEHPAHPRSGSAITELARAALRDANAPEDLLVYLPNPDPQDLTVVQALVQHEAVGAVGFTGSLRAGLAIERLARDRPSGPIPAFCEMGSVNPVLITAAALRARADAIANALADSVLMRFGQQCTRPGLIFLEASDAIDAFTRVLTERVQKSVGRDMLAPWVAAGFNTRVQQLAAIPGVQVLTRGQLSPSPTPRSTAAALFQTTTTTLALHHAAREEVFGPATVLVHAPALAPDTLAAYFPPNVRSLTWSLFHEPSDLAQNWFAPLLDRATARAGRINFNTVPTGVRVCDAMIHGGPYPATNRPDSTAVGPMAIERWCRPITYQNAPAQALPASLRDDVTA